MAVWLVCVAILALLSQLADGRIRAAQATATDVKNVPISISDFELFSSAVSPSRSHNQKTTSSDSKKNETPVYADTDSAPVQARLVIDAFANGLVEEFHKNGYTASRVSGPPPTNGVLLRGVFAETDGTNRIRRAILGAGAPGPTFTLYVAAFNLAHPAQPLYLPAVVQSADSHYGPVITLNAYVPMVKFDVPKAPTVEDVHKFSGQIASGLTKLLQANPDAVAK